MHCVAGDGIGILAGAVIGGLLVLPRAADLALEYVLGFAFGWSIFQALFMRDMAGGSYLRSLKSTFLPELLSMNCLMAGMVPVMMISMASVTGSRNPHSPAFWFIMSMALLAGSIAAYPMNWWLVARHLKHGMLTVRQTASVEPHHNVSSEHASHPMQPQSPAPGSEHNTRTASVVTAYVLARVTLVSVVVLGVGLSVAVFFSRI
jgi:hypothetical protein